MESIIGFIPARGGSKRIPNKNLKKLAGKPLLAYTIEAAVQSELFTDIIVSSDNRGILDLASEMGVNVDLRPEHLAGDMVQSFEVVEEYLNRSDMAGKYQHVVKLLPTCPMRLPKDLVLAYKMYTEFDGDCFLVSIAEYDFPPQLALEAVKGGPTIKICEPKSYAVNVTSQTFRPRYRPNGAIYMAPVDAFLNAKTFFANPLIGYKMPPERSVDIDLPHQMQIAELLMEKNLRNREKFAGSSAQ